MPFGYLLLQGSGDISYVGMAIATVLLAVCFWILLGYFVLLTVRIFRSVRGAGTFAMNSNIIAYCCGIIVFIVTLLINIDPVLIGAAWRLERAGGDATYHRLMDISQTLVENQKASEPMKIVDPIDGCFRAIGGVSVNVHIDHVDVVTLMGREYSAGWLIYPNDEHKPDKQKRRVRSGLYRYCQ